ncbi:hypothetical protein EK21DRAFT_119093 [Setomelanomma holmii]|uniref:Uncharacterized protein n=1 Tax=Setomelanomma holmii TaxID=210430 RepID=A0A9P4GUD6_9PLEO|nr:hypothetical protein EK21DRAFT_119093 [Setomelanomma holmii]
MTVIKENDGVVDCDGELELSRQLQARAYALYCCAAKHKSTSALRDDTELFEQLSGAEVFSVEDLSTELVLSCGNDELRVLSDRPTLHFDAQDGLAIYIPADSQQRRACYGPQLPKLFAKILGVDHSAAFDISEVLKCRLADLDVVLVEQDIAPVS